jgi:hypothetical protein
MGPALSWALGPNWSDLYRQFPQVDRNPLEDTTGPFHNTKGETVEDYGLTCYGTSVL